MATFETLRRIRENDVRGCILHVIVICYHKSGQWYANRELTRETRPRDIDLQWWRAATLEDWRKPENNDALNVLWPLKLPDDHYVKQWLDDVPDDRRFFDPRRPFPGQGNKFFDSEAGRNTMEQAFLIKGAYIRSLPKEGSELMRPLGYNKLRGAGFGTMFATYRNCPNNCPLVMWWGDQGAGYPLNQWYPLLPRRVRE